MRVFRDVIVRTSGDDEWIVTSREEAIAGETLVLETDVDGYEMKMASREIASPSA